MPFRGGPGTPFKEIDRWWGCEISFDAILRHSITVRTSNAVRSPSGNSKQAICDRITPTPIPPSSRLEPLEEAEAAAASSGIETGVDTGHTTRNGRQGYADAQECH